MSIFRILRFICPPYRHDLAQVAQRVRHALGRHRGHARVVVDVTKEMGGKPFLTDANTLYVGSRKNALDHLETAYANGFNPFVT